MVSYISYESIFHKKQTSLPLRFAITIRLNEREDYTKFRDGLSNVGHPMGYLQDLPNDISYEYILSFPNGVSERDYTVQQSIYFHDDIFVKVSRQFVNDRLVGNIESPYIGNKNEVRIANSGTLDSLLNPMPFMIRG